jgi:hypothetical protein
MTARFRLEWQETHQPNYRSVSVCRSTFTCWRRGNRARGKQSFRPSQGLRRVLAVPDKHLDDLRLQLERRGLCASFRGEGRAAFLFVEYDGNAVEISDHEGRWWVEFWDASEDEDAAPVKDSFFATPGQAVDAAAFWLLPRNGPGGGAAHSQTSIELDRPLQ